MGVSSPARSFRDAVTMRRRMAGSTGVRPMAPSSVSDGPLVRPVDVLHLFVGAALDDLAALHDDDFVRVANRTEPVRNDDRRAAAAPHALVDVHFAEGMR